MSAAIRGRAQLFTIHRIKIRQTRAPIPDLHRNETKKKKTKTISPTAETPPMGRQSTRGLSNQQPSVITVSPDDHSIIAQRQAECEKQEEGERRSPFSTSWLPPLPLPRMASVLRRCFKKASAKQHTTPINKRTKTAGRTATRTMAVVLQLRPEEEPGRERQRRVRLNRGGYIDSRDNRKKERQRRGRFNREGYVDSWVGEKTQRRCQ
jgi:hypothetical protein